MRTRPALHTLVRRADRSSSERRLLAAALVALIRQRRRTLALVTPCLAHLPLPRHPKLDLWRSVARAMAGAPAGPFSISAVQATQAYRAAQLQAVHCSWSPAGRCTNAQELSADLRRLRPPKLVLFHHYDSRGLLPQSWSEALLALQVAGWQVLISSSALQPETTAELMAAGVLISSRRNLGRCLGAYKDLALLLAQTPELSSGLRSLVLCNDSTLPLSEPAVLLRQLQAWCSEGEISAVPVLAGLTDSAERDRYHLQSFCLHANRALLQHPAWLRFWLGFSLQGSKDDLINHGEIGLSQALLAARVQLRPAYPLVQGLLEDPAMAEELQRYSIWQPRHVNQSLFAWQSLLARGFPLVKKHVLFELIENQGLPMAMAELSRWIPEERRALLAADLQQLFVSRYSGRVPEMG